MKKIILLMILIVFAAASVSAFGKKESKPSEPPGNNSGVAAESGSVPSAGFQQVPGSPKKPEDAVVKETEITGLVERGFENRISIVVNPGSKSRVSYYPDEKWASQLEKMLGKTVTVTGKVRNTGNPFKKEIEISEIRK